MLSVREKRIVYEKLFVALLDRIIEARGLDGELLFLPQRDLRARDLLRDGRIPDEVLDDIVALFDRAMTSALAVAAHDWARAA
jgi:hypothetical protein